MLGSPYFVQGIVRKGNQIGRTIGFPTVNILPEDINVTGAESENQNTVGSTATTSVSNRAYSELYGIYVYGEIVSIYAKGFIGSNFAAYGYF